MKISGESQYIELGAPIGVTTTRQRQERFMITTAMRFATQQDHAGKFFEDTVFWYEMAVRGDAVFL